MRKPCFRGIATYLKTVRSVRCLQKPLFHIANTGETAQCLYSPCSGPQQLQSCVLAPQAARGRGSCSDPLRHNDTAQPILSHAWQKQRLQHGANGLPAGAGVPACFPDPFRSLQLLRHHCDRGKPKIHSWAASAGEAGTQHPTGHRVWQVGSCGRRQLNGKWYLISGVKRDAFF